MILFNSRYYPDLINFDEIRQEYLDKDNFFKVLKTYFKGKSFDIHFPFEGLNDSSVIHFISIALRVNDFNLIFLDLQSKKDVGIKEKIEEVIGQKLTMYIPN